MGGATPVFATSQEQVGWKPPPDDYIKINVDASYVESISAASVGVVVRNSSGEVIISSWDFLGQCCSVNEADRASQFSQPASQRAQSLASVEAHSPPPAHSTIPRPRSGRHGNGAARERRRRRGRAGGDRGGGGRGLVRAAAVRGGLGVRAGRVRGLLRGVPRAAGRGRGAVAGVPRRARRAAVGRGGGRHRRLRHLGELQRRARRRALDPGARRPHPPPARRRQARPRRLLRPPDPVPGAGRQDREVVQGLGHRRQLHPPHRRRREALRAAQDAGAPAHHRVPPGRGVGAACSRRGAGPVGQDRRGDVPAGRPRHGRAGPPRVQQGHPHEHRRPPPPPEPPPGLPGGRGQGELRRAAAGQGVLEEGVPGVPQGQAPAAEAAT